MEEKYGFKKFTVQEFKEWLATIRVNRTIIRVMEHHTYRPAYAHFRGDNHFDLQRGMQNYHKYNNGWMDLGQHFSIFPDGTILTGRDIEFNPACISGKNTGAICIENVGDFDIGQDKMTREQANAIVEVTAALCKKFNLPINTSSIIYHHWFAPKSCPGTNFFGGNTMADCEKNFLPLVEGALGGEIKETVEEIKYFVSVTATNLNIRIGPGTNFARASDNPTVSYSSVLRVYKESGNWIKISNSQERWVYKPYTMLVKRAVVNVTDKLNVRRGPGTRYNIITTVSNADIVYVYKEENGWCKINMFDQWVSKRYLKF